MAVNSMFIATMLVVLLANCEIADGVNESRMRIKRADGETVTPTAEPEPEHDHHNNHTRIEEFENSSGPSIGTIIGVVIGVIIAIALVILVIIVIFKIKNQRSSNIERDTKVQMSTAKNAGVYVDLTTNPETAPEDKEVKETDKLHTEEA